MSRTARHEWLLRAAAAFILGLPVAAPAQERQDHAAILQAVENYLRIQTSGMPGLVTVSVGAIDPRTALPACPALDVYVPAGARLWGATSVGVRCGGPAWNLYVSAQVRVTGNYVVTARPVALGKPLEISDLTTQSGDLTRLPVGILTDARHALGKTASTNLLPGEPLRQEMLKAALAVQQGQAVKLQSGGTGFRVSAEGLALSNAHEGQLAQVRAPSGQTVSGIARAGGVVEVRY